MLEGRAIGRELAPEGAGEVPARAFTDVLSALGFAPVLAPEGTDGVCCRLENCPYVEAVREGPDVVCSLHRGITEGLIEVLEPRARLARWEPRDPESAGCIAAIEGAPGWRRQLEEG